MGIFYSFKWFIWGFLKKEGGSSRVGYHPIENLGGNFQSSNIINHDILWFSWWELAGNFSWFAPRFWFNCQHQFLPHNRG
jgi:hypothetical protein